MSKILPFLQNFLLQIPYQKLVNRGSGIKLLLKFKKKSFFFFFFQEQGVTVFYQASHRQDIVRCGQTEDLKSFLSLDPQASIVFFYDGPQQTFKLLKQPESLKGLDLYRWRYRQKETFTKESSWAGFYQERDGQSFLAAVLPNDPVLEDYYHQISKLPYPLKGIYPLPLEYKSFYLALYQDISSCNQVNRAVFFISLEENAWIRHTILFQKKLLLTRFFQGKKVSEEEIKNTLRYALKQNPGISENIEYVFLGEIQKEAFSSLEGKPVYFLAASEIAKSLHLTVSPLKELFLKSWQPSYPLTLKGKKLVYKNLLKKIYRYTPRFFSMGLIGFVGISLYIKMLFIQNIHEIHQKIHHLKIEKDLCKHHLLSLPFIPRPMDTFLKSNPQEVMVLHPLKKLGKIFSQGILLQKLEWKNVKNSCFYLKFDGELSSHLPSSLLKKEVKNLFSHVQVKLWKIYTAPQRSLQNLLKAELIINL